MGRAPGRRGFCCDDSGAGFAGATLCWCGSEAERVGAVGLGRAGPGSADCASPGGCRKGGLAAAPLVGPGGTKDGGTADLGGYMAVMRGSCRMSVCSVNLVAVSSWSFVKYARCFSDHFCNEDRFEGSPRQICDQLQDLRNHDLPQ